MKKQSKKKSSVLIQLSGWLRTLDMAKNRNFDRNRVRGCNFGSEGGAVLNLGGCNHGFRGCITLPMGTAINRRR